MSPDSNQGRTDPHIYSPAEIEMFLKGDSREIDRLILESTNNIVRAFTEFRDLEFRPHVEDEKALQKALGEPNDIERRRRWLDLQIDKAEKCQRIRAKIIEATLTRYVSVVLVFLIVGAVTGIFEHAYDLWAGWKITHTSTNPNSKERP